MARAKRKDAIAMLKADHRKVEGLFAKFRKATRADDKKALADEICLELRVHATIEEDVFYPGCREAGVEVSLMDEANVEHDSAKVLIAEIENTPPSDEFYDAKVKVLSEMIKHHVNEEEKKRGNMFAKARTAKVDFAALGEKMAAEKEHVMAKLKATAHRPAPPTPSFKSTELAA